MKNTNKTALIIGLGNIGKQYEGTRHNVGFVVVDKLAKHLQVGFSCQAKLLADVARARQIIIAKPTTLMNRSGLSVSKIRDYYKIPIENIIVISDDYHLDLGQVRLRFEGESGGHNGLESVIEQISGGFWRLRIGIGEVNDKKAEEYVLGRFTLAEMNLINKVIDRAIEFLLESLSDKKLENKSFIVGPEDK